MENSQISISFVPLVENHKTTNMHITLSRAFQHYQKQRVRSYDLERLQNDHIQTNKKHVSHVSHVSQFINCVHVFMCLILLDLIMLVTIIFMHKKKWFNVLFNLMELSLVTSYVEPSNPTIWMLLGFYKELEVAQNF